MNGMMKAIAHNAVGLALFAIVTAGLIAATHRVTADRIVDAELRARSAALLEIIPASTHDNDLLKDVVVLPPSKLLGTMTPTEAFVARRDGAPVGVILTTVAPDGYSGEIRSLVGIDAAGQIIGVRVVSHRETPGLGDKVELRKSDWVRDFEGKSLNDPAPDRWKVQKDGGEFDQMTGATITPRAVVGSVKNALVFFSENRDALMPGHSDTQEASLHVQ